MKSKVNIDAYFTNEYYVSLRISHPRALGKGNLGFVLTYILEPNKEELAVETGWRVFRGSVVPPSQQDKRGHWFATITPHIRLQTALDKLVCEWRPRFPDVQFPDSSPTVETQEARPASKG